MVSPTGENLIFLLGMPRSGTTLLSVMLNNHPQVLVPPEPWVMPAVEAVGRVAAHHPADAPVLWQAFGQFCSAEDRLAAARAFAQTAYNRKLAGTGRTILVDKTPRNYLILPFLEQVFPHARYVLLRRNPLDVAASFKRTWKVQIAQLLEQREDHPACFDFALGAARLEAFAARRSDVVILRYEDLVREPEETMRGLVAALGLNDAKTTELATFDLAGSSFASSYAGDKKIIETNAPHQQSVGSWSAVLSAAEARQLVNCIGAARMTAMGYGEVLQDPLLAAAAPASDVEAAACVRWLEEAVARRMSEYEGAGSFADLVVAERRLRSILYAGAWGKMQEAESPPENIREQTLTNIDYATAMQQRIQKLEEEAAELRAAVDVAQRRITDRK